MKNTLADVLRRCRRGGVAIVIAVLAPVLVAATGLAVDTGYWYQEEVSLQSAADAAAMAAAEAQLTYTNLTPTQAQSFATAAANAATNGQFSFTAGTGANSINLTQPDGTHWKAIATAPRARFFSGVKGMGLGGLPLGNQSAAAVTAAIPPSASACLLTTSNSGNDLSVQSSGGTIDAVNCSIYSDSASCTSSSNSSIAATNGGQIIGQSVSTAIGGCAYESGSASGTYVGTSADYSGANLSGNGNSTGYGVTATPPPPDFEASSDPLTTSTSTDLAWPAMPTAATPPTSTLCNGGAGVYSGNTLTLAINCYYAGLTSNAVNIYAGTASAGASTLAASGVTEISGGLANSQNGTSVTGFGGGQLYVSGNMTINLPSSASTFSTLGGGSSQYVFSNAVQFSGNGTGAAITLGQASYYFQGQGSTQLINLGSQLSVASGSSFYYGGTGGFFNSNASNGSFTFGGTTSGAAASGTGLYEFNSEVALTTQDTITFAGGTYLFNCGLSVTNAQAKIYFGPGIYFINKNASCTSTPANATLDLEAGTVIATGATFVLMGSANYYLGNNSAGNTINLAAPTSAYNCMAPSQFTGSYLSSVTASTGYQGICGILFYQARNDSATDYIQNSNTTTYLTGMFYQPGATLVLQGTNGVFEAEPSTATDADGHAYSGTLAVEASTVSNSNTGKLYFSEGTGSGSSSASTAMALLVQ